MKLRAYRVDRLDYPTEPALVIAASWWDAKRLAGSFWGYYGSQYHLRTHVIPAFDQIAARYAAPAVVTDPADLAALGGGT